MTRQPGLRGLLPFDQAKHDRFKYSYEYSSFQWPTPTYPIDKSGGIEDYGMDGNGPDPSLTVNGGNPVGDCGVAAVPGHANMITAVLGGLDLASNTMTSNELVTLYFTYQAELAGISWRPSGDSWVAPDGLDNGVDLGDWLLWLFNNGYIEGFVKIGLDDMDAALAATSVVVCGVSLNPQADNQYAEGKPWDIGPGDEPNPMMGHAILYIGAESTSGPYYWCSWGAKQPSTAPWKGACPQQAFAVLTKQDAQSVSFPFAALCADLKAQGGTVVSSDTPSTPAIQPLSIWERFLRWLHSEV